MNNVVINVSVCTYVITFEGREVSFIHVAIETHALCLVG